MKKEHLEHGRESATVQIPARSRTAWQATTTIPSRENLTNWSIQQPLIILMDEVKPLQEVPADNVSISTYK